ncbi:MAG: MOSC domain-containing protein [Chloroflexota bacterium]
MHVSALYTYPIKSCRGTPVDSAQVGPRGIQGDRQLMLVTTEGNFLTQRQHPRMALIYPQWQADYLKLVAPAMPDQAIQPTNAGPRRRVVVWRDTCDAIDQGDRAAEWFSEYLGFSCRLVRMADDFVRQVNQAYAPRPSDQTGFADGYPFLIVSQASLDDLNTRLSAPLPMDRFRPNLVIAGCMPFAEDGWQVIRVGDLLFDVVKPCARCVVTTTDQDTAVRGKEPLNTLAAYRTLDGKVMFGQNAIHRSGGQICRGDTVDVLKPGLPSKF